MKKLLSNKVFQIGLMSFVVIASSILFYYILSSVNGILNFLGNLLDILMPLIIGLVLAYIMNPIVKIFDKKVFKKIKKDKVRRNISILVTVVIIIALLASLISVIIPQLLNSIETLIVNIPDYISNLEKFINSFIDNTELKKLVLSNYDNVADFIINTANNVLLPATDNAIETLGKGLSGFVAAIFNFAVGAVFAIYILANTKEFSASIRRFLYSIFKVDHVNDFLEETNHVNKIFGQFMLGKICGSTLVALMTFTFLMIFNFPYPLLIAVIIGITDLIPYFGPYIGSIPSALLILLVSPIKAISFVLFMVVLQQIDGNFTTPWLQKQATGLPSFWVLFAITLFGGLFGLVGMLIGVPCFTIIYEFINERTKRRLKKKNLPTDVEYYENISGLQEKVIKSKVHLKDTKEI